MNGDRDRFGWWLLAITILVNITAFALGGWSLLHNKEHHEQRARLQTENLTQAIDQSISNSIDKFDLALQTLVHELEKQLSAGRLNEDLTRDLVRTQENFLPEIIGVRVLDAQGIPRFGKGAATNPPVSFAGMEYFPLMRDHHGAGLVITKPVIGLVVKTWVISFMRRYNRSDGSFAGLVVIAVSPDYFNDLLSRFGIGTHGLITLRDIRDLGLIAGRRADDDQILQIGNRNVSQTLKDRVASGIRQTTYRSTQPFDGLTRMVSFRRLEKAPMLALAALAEDDYLSPWHQEVAGTAMFLAAFLCITIFSAALVWRNMQHRKRGAAVLLESQNRLEAAHLELERRVIERTAQLRQVAIEATLAEERERLAIAHDLHDDLGQLLHVARIKIDALVKQLPHAEGDAVQSLHELLANANRLVRSLTSQLSPPVLSELGLVPALRWLGEEMGRNYGLEVEFEDDEARKPLTAAQSVILFRATRELLINIAKHARTQDAWVRAQDIDGCFIVTVEDNGVGIPDLQAAFSRARGFGMASVRERIAFLGGRMEVRTAPGEGTSVILTMPFTGQEQSRAEGAA